MRSGYLFLPALNKATTKKGIYAKVNYLLLYRNRVKR